MSPRRAPGLAGLLLVAIATGGCGGGDDYCAQVAVVMDAGATGAASGTQRTEVLDALSSLTQQSEGTERADWEAFAALVRRGEKGAVPEAELARLDPALDRLQEVVGRRCSVPPGRATSSGRAGGAGGAGPGMPWPRVPSLGVVPL